MMQLTRARSTAVGASAWTITDTMLVLLAIAAALPLRMAGVFGFFGSVSVLELGVLIAIGYSALLVFRSGLVVVGDTNILLVIAAPTLAALLSIVWTIDVAASEQALALQVLALGGMLGALHLGASTKLRTVSLALSAFVVMALTASIFFYLGVPGFGLYVPPGTTASVDRLVTAYSRFSHPFIGLSNDYAPVLGFAAFLLFGGARTGARWTARICGAAGTLAVVGMLLTLSRGVIASFLLSAMLYALFVRVRWGRVAVMTGVLALVATVVIQANSDAAVRVGTHVVGIDELIADRVRSVVNVEARQSGYLLTWKLVEERPWTGYGAGVLDPGREGALQETSHSTVLQSLLWYGGLFGGLVAAAWLALPLVVRVRYGQLRGVEAQGRDAVVCGLTFIVLASLTETFMEATTTRVLIFVLLGLAFATLVLLERQSKAAARS